MPHATSQHVNGDKASSQFINRLSSYPAVNDGVETFKTNPYGKSAIELVDEAYSRFGKPVEPYLETPWAYAKPYVQKGDELADNGLSHVENHFPIVKEDTHTIIETGKSYVFWPYNYLSSTWSDEYSKTVKHKGRGPGVGTSIMALISTELRIAADFFHTVADILGPKYEESKKAGADYVKQLEDTANNYKQIGQDKIAEYQKFAQEKLGDAQKVGEEKAQETKEQANQTKEQTKEQAHQTKEQAKETKDKAHKEAHKHTHHHSK